MSKVLLIDGHSILNRAFYGLPDLTNAEGAHTGAVYGFLTILFKLLEEEKPDYLTVAFDVHAPTFRHEMYEAYKGTRKGMPEELKEQVPLLKKVLDAMGVCRIEQAGLEASWGVWPNRHRQTAMRSSLYRETEICCRLRMCIFASICPAPKWERRPSNIIMQAMCRRRSDSARRSLSN